MKITSLLVLALAPAARAMFQLSCGEACTGVADGFTLNCTTATGEILDWAPCQAQNIAYLSTVAWCLQSRCTTASRQAILYYWDWIQRDREVTWPSYDSVLPSTEPPLVPDDLEILNSTVRITDESFWLDYSAETTYEYVERWHHRTGYLLVILVIAGCMIGTVQWLFVTKLHRPHSTTSWHSSSIMTWFKKHLILPAFFNASYRQPILNCLGYLPSRLAALFLFVFFAFNIIFLVAGMKATHPSVWYDSTKMELCVYVANRAGVLSFALLPLTFLLAARNNPLVALTRMTATTYMMLHRWIARACALQALIHTGGWILQAYWRADNTWDTMTYWAAEPWLRWGFVGTVAMCLMVALAAWPVRHRSYELFLVMHIVLGVLSLVGSWYHIDFLYANRYGYKNWLYVAFGIWGADRLIRSLHMLYLSWPAITRKPNALARAEILPGGTDIVKLTIPTRLGLTTQPGQYAFVHFASLFKPWENHPFSIASWSVGGGDVERGSLEPSEESSENLDKRSQTDSVPSFTPAGPSITMIIRTYEGATARIRDAVQKNGGPVTLPILLEGSYGHPQPLHVYETQILIAGGVGIASILGYVQAFATSPENMKTKRMVVVWSAREAHLLRSVAAHELSNLPGNIDLRLHCTDSQAAKVESKSSISYGRPDLLNIIQSETSILPSGERAAVFVCGSGGMLDEVRRTVVGCIGSGPGQVDGDRLNFFDEAFAW